jgi:hypothetical protein
MNNALIAATAGNWTEAAEALKGSISGIDWEGADISSPGMELDTRIQHAINLCLEARAFGKFDASLGRLAIKAIEGLIAEDDSELEQAESFEATIAAVELGEEID